MDFRVVRIRSVFGGRYVHECLSPRVQNLGQSLHFETVNGPLVDIALLNLYGHKDTSLAVPPNHLYWQDDVEQHKMLGRSEYRPIRSYQDAVRRGQASTYHRFGSTPHFTMAPLTSRWRLTPL